MKYSKLIEELEYWKRISDEEDPEIVIHNDIYCYEISEIRPVLGIKNSRAIGIEF